MFPLFSKHCVVTERLQSSGSYDRFYSDNEPIEIKREIGAGTHRGYFPFLNN